MSLNVTQRGQWWPVSVLGSCLPLWILLSPFNPAFCSGRLTYADYFKNSLDFGLSFGFSQQGYLQEFCRRAEREFKLWLNSASARLPQAGCFPPVKGLCSSQVACLYARALSSGLFHCSVIFVILSKSLFMLFTGCMTPNKSLNLFEPQFSYL